MGMDSNHRRHSQQIYSLSPLATREPIHIKADDRNRTDNLLITDQLLCQLSYVGISSYISYSQQMGPTGLEPVTPCL
jgi:hypothetical protein